VLGYDHLDKSILQLVPSVICTSGSIHGVVEGYMIEQQWEEITDEKLTEFVFTVCQSARNDSVRALYLECIHGIGHALMFITGNNLPLSLKLCDNVPPLPPMSDATLCYSGVFMENNLGAAGDNRTASGHVSDYLSRPDDPLYPCSILEEQYLPLCYQYRADFSLRLNGDFDKAIELCLQVPDKYQSFCFYRLGKSISYRIPEHVQVIAMCDKVYPLAGSTLRLKCLEGVIAVILWKYEDDAGKLASFCNLFKKEGGAHECHDIATRLKNERQNNK